MFRIINFCPYMFIIICTLQLLSQWNLRRVNKIFCNVWRDLLPNRQKLFLFSSSQAFKIGNIGTISYCNLVKPFIATNSLQRATSPQYPFMSSHIHVLNIISLFLRWQPACNDHKLLIKTTGSTQGYPIINIHPFSPWCPPPPNISIMEF